ncbi:hypothetical protein [Streptomyces sp. NPDC058548]|uniref:hypothetical protein n=1 Tax=Streptomyces sp. NPDC058548 TaxID=3346545 RepID=UPI003666ECAB
MTDEMSPPSADRQVVRDWLTYLYSGCPGYLSICSDKDGWAGRRFTTDEVGLGAAADYTVALDKRVAKGVYAQVTTLREKPVEGRGGEDLAYGLTHLWADGDYGTIGHKPGLDDLPAPPNAEGVQKVVAESGLPTPSGWAHTGGGYNPIWVLAERHLVDSEEGRQRVKAVTTGLQAVLAATAYRLGWSWDVEVGNLDRLMKVPGTVNRKEGLERPTAIGPGTGEVHELAGLAAAIAELAPAAREVLEQSSREKQERKARRTGASVPPPRRDRPSALHSGGRGTSVFDILAAELAFRDVLEPAGWTYRGTAGDGREKWLRPAGAEGTADSDYSLVCDDHVAVNWSERSGLPVGQQPTGRKLTVPTLWAHLYYGGNEREATLDVLRAAFDQDAQAAARALPVAVLGRVRQHCRPPAQRRDLPVPPVDDMWGPTDEPPAPDENRGAAPHSSDAEPDDRLPNTFWNATPTLGQIQQMARARRTSPDAVLHALLARVAAMADPTVRASSGIHSPATLGWYCGLFGPPGTSKGQAEKAAAVLAPFPQTNLAHIDISTGQGMIAAYLELKDDPDDDKGKKKILVQSTSRGYALATEGSVLEAMAQMSVGAMLNGVLCKAWMSERQGTSNADIERRRVLPEDSYTLSMSLGVQEEPAAKLLEMGSIGLPQRLAWAHARLSQDTPKERPAVTGPVFVTTQNGEDVPVTTWVSTLRSIVIPVPVRATQELDDLVLEIAFGRGEEFPLDTHEPLWRLKCAALLALLHGRTTVSEEDWDLAAVMWRTSRSVRNRVQEAARRRLRAQKEARVAEAVQTAVESQAAVYESLHGVHPSVVNVAKRAHRYLQRNEGEISARDVNRNCIKKPDRDKYRASGATDSLWSAALQHGCEQGWLVVLEGGLLVAGTVAPE